MVSRAFGVVTKLGRQIYADRYFGIKADGTTDDYDGLIDFLYEVVENGADGVFPPGRFTTSAALSLSGFSGTKRPFTLRGHGLHTVIERLDGCGTLFNFRACPEGVVVRDMRFKVYASTRPTNANNCIVIGGSSYALVQNIVVDDPRAGAVMILSEVASGEGAIEGCLIDNVRVNGVPSGSNIGVDVGILIAGQQVSRSGITNCQVYGGGRDVALNPGIGIELKYTGPGCWIDNCYANNYIQGFGMAGSDILGYCKEARISNVYAMNCGVGFNGGWLENSTVTGLVIDMDDQTTDVNEPIQISRSNNVYKGVVIKNAGAPLKYHVRFIGDAANNVVDVDVIDNANSCNLIASFESTTDRNVVNVRRMANPAITAMTAANVIQDNTTGKTNLVNIDELPVVIQRTIASDEITINDPRSPITVIVDTEGGAATDDLFKINGLFDRQIVILCAQANARDTTYRHAAGGFAAGNFELVGGADFAPATAAGTLVLQYRSSISKCVEISRASL